MACCDECEKMGGSCAPKTTALGAPLHIKLPGKRPEPPRGRDGLGEAPGNQGYLMGLGASDVPDLDSALQTMIGDATVCSGAQNANVQNVQTEYNAAFPGSAIPVSGVLDQVTLNAINGYLGLIQASYTLSCTGSTGAVVQGPAPITPVTPTPWGTYALLAGSAVAVGALAMVWQRRAHDATALHSRLRRANPAHENFVGRRVELHPGRGTVSRVEGDTLIVKTKHKLIRVRKDRVTLI